jgi:hypothetical protein
MSDGIAENTPSRVIAVYAQGALTGSQLQDAIADALNELQSPSAEISESGLTADDLRRAEFKVDEEAGYDPESIRLVVEWVGNTVGGGAAYEASKFVAIKIWRAVLHQLKKRHGSDALGDEDPDLPFCE